MFIVRLFDNSFLEKFISSCTINCSFELNVLGLVEICVGSQPFGVNSRNTPFTN